MIPTEGSLWLLHFNQEAAGREFGVSPALITVAGYELYAGEDWVIVEQNGQPLRHLYPDSFVPSPADRGDREVYAIPLTSPIACPACNREGDRFGQEDCPSCQGKGWLNGEPRILGDTQPYLSLRAAVRQFATMDEQGKSTATIRQMMINLAKKGGNGSA